jgi:hypothetical protein
LSNHSVFTFRSKRYYSTRFGGKSNIHGNEIAEAPARLQISAECGLSQIFTQYLYYPVYIKGFAEVIIHSRR